MPVSLIARSALLMLLNSSSRAFAHAVAHCRVVTIAVFTNAGEEQPAREGVHHLCWDDALQDRLHEQDPGVTTTPGFHMFATVRAALWGANAVTVEAAARLDADSECLKYFTAEQRNRILQDIAFCKAQQGNFFELQDLCFASSHNIAQASCS
eukprot:11713-Heterococcus_DN1.PRE.1